MAEADTKEAIVNAILEHGTLTKACEALGLSRNTVYAWRQQDSYFDEQVRTALNLAQAQGATGEETEDVALLPEETERGIGVDESAETMDTLQPVTTAEPATTEEELTPRVVAAVHALQNRLIADWIFAQNSETERHRFRTIQQEMDGEWTEFLDAIQEAVAVPPVV